MKPRILLSLLITTALFAVLIHGCKKDKDVVNTGSTGIATSFTEDFEDMTAAFSRGWVSKNNTNSGDAEWGQGIFRVDKFGTWIGFSAYSGDSLEYAGAAVKLYEYENISSWLLSPVLSVKNGDKISFYTRAETGYMDRLQVCMNNSASQDVGATSVSVGRFTTVLLDINPTVADLGYPQSWLKFEHTFAGISGKVDTRIGFRYFVPQGKTTRGIGIDQFKFTVQ